jgi:hypothetical protein
MSMKRVQIALGVVAALAGIAIMVAAPWMAASQLSAALKSGDADAISRMVDFPSVRSSLSTQLTAKINEEARNDPQARDNPFAGLVTLLAPTIVNQLVSVIVTPEGLAKLSREAQRAEAESDARRRARGKARDRGEGGMGKPVLAYTGINTFTATYSSRTRGKVVWVLGRDKLFFWKLKKVEVSDLMLEDLSADARRN